MRLLASLMLPLAALLVSAAPAGQVIPHPEVAGEALIVPPESPVRFRGFDKYGRAHFSGRFVLTGYFSYGCRIDCDGPAKDAFFRFDLLPDPALAARLPHWTKYDNDIMINVSRDSPLIRKIATQRQRADIKAQRIADIEGRITIVVDQFETGLDCESANFSARFVALPKAPVLAKAEFNGDYGCG
jgi:hypothetical protein